MKTMETMYSMRTTMTVATATIMTTISKRKMDTMSTPHQQSSTKSSPSMIFFLKSSSISKLRRKWLRCHKAGVCSSSGSSSGTLIYCPNISRTWRSIEIKFTTKNSTKSQIMFRVTMVPAKYVVNPVTSTKIFAVTAFAKIAGKAIWKRTFSQTILS